MTELARGDLHDVVWTLAGVLLSVEIIRAMIRLVEDFWNGLW